MQVKKVAINDIEGLEDDDELRRLFDKTVPLSQRRVKARLELIEIERAMSDIWEGSNYMRIPSPVWADAVVCLMIRDGVFLHIVEGGNDG